MCEITMCEITMCEIYQTLMLHAIIDFLPSFDHILFVINITVAVLTGMIASSSRPTF